MGQHRRPSHDRIGPSSSDDDSWIISKSDRQARSVTSARRSPGSSCGQTVDEPGSARSVVSDRRLTARGGERGRIRRIAERASGTSNAASRGRTHVSTRPSAQMRDETRLHPTGRPHLPPLARRVAGSGPRHRRAPVAPVRDRPVRQHRRAGITRPTVRDEARPREPPTRAVRLWRGCADGMIVGF